MLAFFFLPITINSTVTTVAYTTETAAIKLIDVTVMVVLELHSANCVALNVIWIASVNDKFPIISPQITVCMSKVHKLPSVGTSVQVTVVLVVVVGQLPQFDARML